MGYNWQKNKMKKTTLVLASLFAFIVLCSFTTKTHNITDSKTTIRIESSTTIEATLTNEEYNQQLYLYNDGSCVIRGEGVRGTGKYDIRGNKIYFNWDNGVSQQGSVTRSKDGTVFSVSVEGVTYSREKKVIPRR